MEKILITGISGGHGRLLARRLLESYEVCGVDIQDWEAAPRGIEFYRVDLRKRKFEDVIRTAMPTAIVHLGMVRHFHSGARTRHDVNVRGTQQLLDHCIHHGVQKLVVVSSGYVYGAFPENPYNMDEDSPLSASRSYAAIRDLVEMDALASAFLWRYPHIRTCVLRPVNTLGRSVHSLIAQYFRQHRIPTVMGFDPMLQFIHEEDVSEAIALALEHGLQGVFNVVGPGEVPLHTAIQEIGGQALSLPEFVMRPLFARLFAMGAIAYPPAAIDYLKFPITLSGERFVEATNFRPLFGLEEIFQSLAA
ncbi:MAG: NAD-dependent epimerase/dehydratase family protein [Myxococcota bacterium]|nr:NAD-dependent epimerase [Deltaproteobacteria bacterium]MCP4241511.1 NAD-dependent epimerase/dehydratase family protein [bacterium]MDP6074129.1 NAD-dependent epimerase/dehydratase family protein [Myxococcota bacterium]MDP6241800.1 NAD-dependent epimerase/dehydratase family protein [Myxococcota bacterium]MDP7074564.1 NAD-dependent epimerase/dehydratase family protein [Myxococcota bacterium]